MIWASTKETLMMATGEVGPVLFSAPKLKKWHGLHHEISEWEWIHTLLLDLGATK
jgi:hypothetical protein